jgi:eukaryotic-like serine/threonine-protein kinase
VDPGLLPTSPPRNIDAFEDALEAFDTDWSAAPSYLIHAIHEANCAEHPERCAEFIRVDIDRRYAADLAIDLEHYFLLFPALRESPNAVGAVAYEDYRCRLTRDFSIAPERWQHLPQIHLQDWFRQLASNPSRSSTTTPQLGQPFGDFLLLHLLGKGAFSEVYLAQQQSLASRYVVVKVVRRVLDEPTHLARMQHTGIVPLFSFHRIGDYSLLCMPYTGVTTLQHWLGSTNNAPSTSSRTGESFVETIQESLRQITFSSQRASTVKAAWPTVSKNGSSRQIGPLNIADSNSPAMAEAHQSAGETADESVNERQSFLGWNNAASRPLQQLSNLDHRLFPVWFATRVAAALAHAHERGIVHGDLKPANILLRNDGEPSLIDFNLSQNIDAQHTEIVGGTLPYMAPEQLQALLNRSPSNSPAADIFSFGIILFELLEGRLPFPAAASTAETDIAVALSQMQSTSIRWHTNSGTVGIRAIVAKCLAFKPAERYSTAAELLLDLERESSFLPLRSATEPLIRGRLTKFTKRHPTLISSSAITSLAAGLILVLSLAAYSWWYRSHQLASAAIVETLEDSLQHRLPKLVELPPAEAYTEAIAIRADFSEQGIPLASAEVTPLLAWLAADQQLRLQEGIYDFALVTSFALLQQGEALTTEQIELASQQLALGAAFHGSSESLDLLGYLRHRLALQQAGSHDKTIATDSANMQLNFVSTRPIDNILKSRLLLGAGDPYAAFATIHAVAPEPRHSYLFWLTVGEIQLQLGQPDTAKMSFTLASQADTNSANPVALRGQCHLLLGNLPAAIADYSLAIELSPKDAHYWTLRALVHERNKDWSAALADLTHSLEIAPHSNRIRLIRSRIYQLAGNKTDSRHDYEVAIRQTPDSVDDWVSRALAIARSEPQLAIQDLQQALLKDPSSPLVLQNLAYVQSELLRDYAGARESLDRLLSVRPHHEMARGGRAVLLARLGSVTESLRDIEYLSDNFTKLMPATLYQIASAHALLASQREQCRHDSLKFLAQALQRGYGAALLDSDPDLNSIRDDAAFQALRQSASLATTP